MPYPFFTFPFLSLNSRPRSSKGVRCGWSVKETNSKGPSFSLIKTRRWPPSIGGSSLATYFQVFPISSDMLIGIRSFPSLFRMLLPRPIAIKLPFPNCTIPAWIPAIVLPVPPSLKSGKGAPSQGSHHVFPPSLLI